ncbi:MAG: hypothetical protein ACRC10_02760 [Thermoguttaceae bacterium]
MNQTNHQKTDSFSRALISAMGWFFLHPNTPPELSERQWLLLRLFFVSALGFSFIVGLSILGYLSTQNGGRSWVESVGNHATPWYYFFGPPP